MSARGGWIWYELITPDVGAALDFYGKVVGWKSAPFGSVPGYHLLASQEGEIGGILAPPEGAGFAKPAWFGYIDVADVDAAIAALQKDGATPCMPPMDIPNVGRLAMLLDPQGVGFYVMSTAPGSGESRSFGAGPGRCAWNELVTTDPVAAFAFYGRHFGWESDGVMPMGPLGDYQLFRSGGERSGGIMRRDREGAPPVWRFYFGVDDIDRAAKAIVDGGGRLLQEPQQVPGGAYAAAALDPQGAEFGIAGPRK